MLFKKASEDSEAIVEWIPSSYQFITKKQDNIARETKYKCIAVWRRNSFNKSNYNI